MENKQQQAVWFPPPFFFSFRKLLSYAREMQVHPQQSSHMIRNLFAREGSSFPPLRSRICLRETRKEKGVLLGDREGIKASWQAHGLEMSPIKKTWTHLTLIWKSGAVTVHSLIWETSTIILEIIKILVEWIFWSCLRFPFSHYWQKLHLWIFLF